MKQGLPETLEELEGAITNSLSAYFLGAAWVVWVYNGVDRDVCPSESMFLKDWSPGIFTDDPPDLRAFRAKNLHQFLLRGLIRDCGQFVEHYMSKNDLIPKHEGKESWSKTPAPIYVLRILRNGFNHDWTIGQVHEDVEWDGIVFRKNVGVMPEEGWRRGDPLLPRLHRDFGGGVEIVSELMKGVLEALRKLEADKLNRS